MSNLRFTITKKSENISQWYNDVVLRSELADYSPVKGSMVFRPYGFAIWEKIQAFLDGLIKARGVKNAYFPLFIPESYLKKEKEHVQGFSPQMAVVTIAGGEELKEKLVVRPTSETIMYAMYKDWTRSWRDLPILINQWNNVVRWEKRTYLFLRSSEFLWQEGHCAHATHEESLATVDWALGIYQKTYNELLSLYGIAGIKSETEKFAGAVQTFSYEILMPDGKALQACTSHDLGQNFARAFDWQVQGKDGGKFYPWQNSWGFSTRSIGGLILVCGDDKGLVLPPRVAPTQLVIVPVLKKGSEEKVLNFCQKIKDELTDFRLELDLREGETAGFKFNKWELRGVPLRIEVGEKETASSNLTLVRRDNGQKEMIKLAGSTRRIKEILAEIQKNIFLNHQKFTQDNTRSVSSLTEFKEIMRTKKGFISAFWCGDPLCETKIKEETKASTRCLPIRAPEEKGECVYCQKPAQKRWLFAQSY
ncbi:MAG: proline--tRNA ligase [Candidatus Nealsonbacteria bacterium]|nr:proline--tRNA ligase [Candidatus Nealsonbacteria bacterium]